MKQAASRVPIFTGLHGVLRKKIQLFFGEINTDGACRVNAAVNRANLGAARRNHHQQHAAQTLEQVASGEG
jgi:hypothetical protein